MDPFMPDDSQPKQQEPGPDNTTTPSRLLPAHTDPATLPADTTCWRIELVGLPGQSKVIYDIIADVNVGRGPDADIDLVAIGGMDRGISRQHVILRPTKSALYLIDCESVNGTRINGLPLGRAEARALSGQLVVTLGRLSFTLRVVSSHALSDLIKPPKSDTPEPPTIPTEKTVELRAIARSNGRPVEPDPHDAKTLVSKRKTVLGTAEEYEKWLMARKNRPRDQADKRIPGKAEPDEYES